ncbi:MAG: hypothetical protein HQL56_10000 [Magnetococcales bacterium]|nr:hypothetical protein [Magnetococcales bacterium]
MKGRTLNYPEGLAGIHFKRCVREEAERAERLGGDLEHVLRHFARPGSRFEVDLLHPESLSWQWGGGQVAEVLRVVEGDALSRQRDYPRVAGCAVRSVVVADREKLIGELSRMPPHWLTRGYVTVWVDEGISLLSWEEQGEIHLLMRREEWQEWEPVLRSFHPEVKPEIVGREWWLAVLT